MKKRINFKKGRKNIIYKDSISFFLSINKIFPNGYKEMMEENINDLKYLFTDTK